MKVERNSAQLAMNKRKDDSRAPFAERLLRNPNVRRRLFVDDDDERPENRQRAQENRSSELAQQIREDLEKFKERWNFDIQTETPLPGNWVWTKLDKDGNEVPNPVSNGVLENGDRLTIQNGKIDSTEVNL